MRDGGEGPYQEKGNKTFLAEVRAREASKAGKNVLYVKTPTKGGDFMSGL